MTSLGGIKYQKMTDYDILTPFFGPSGRPRGALFNDVDPRGHPYTLKFDDKAFPGGLSLTRKS